MADDLSAALDALAYCDPSVSRDEWIAIGMALHEAGADFETFDRWSAGAPDRYQARACRDVWASFRRGGGRGIGTLFEAAKRGGYTPRNGSARPMPTAEERAAQEAKRRADREADERARAKRHDESAELARLVWAAGQPVGADNPYLQQKRVAPTETMRELRVEPLARELGYTPKARGEALEGRVLLLPITGDDGRMRSLEFVDEAGRKSALAGGQKSGGYWPTGSLKDARMVLLGEGAATVMAASQAVDVPGAAALSVGNLLKAGRSIQASSPGCKLAILADLMKSAGEPEPLAVQAAKALGAALLAPDFGPNRDPGQKDWADLLGAAGADEARRQIRAAIAGSADVVTDVTVEDRDDGSHDEPVDDSDGWPEPLPIGGATVDQIAYPVEALPPVLREAVAEVAGFVQCPVAIAAASALTVASVAAQGHFNIRRASGLVGPVGLFVLAVASSGERKSSADKLFCDPLREYEREAEAAAQPALAKWRAELAAWEAEVDGLKQGVRNAARSGDSDSLADYRQRLQTVEGAKPVRPKVPRLAYSDSTSEALAWGLATNWPTAALMSAEAGAVLGGHAMGKDSILRTLALLNTLWDGGDAHVDRRSSESFTLRGVRLTCGLAIQPEALAAFLEKSGTLARGSGFLARFLVCHPESTQGTRKYRHGPDSWPALGRFHRHIRALLDKPLPLDPGGCLAPVVLDLSPGAQAAWIDLHNDVESELAQGGELESVRDVASKAADNAARLAAIFHSLDGDGELVGEAHMTAAGQIVVWHLTEARRLLAEVYRPPAVNKAERLDSWLLAECMRTGGNAVPVREALNRGPNGTRALADFSEAAAALAALGRVRLGTAGRKRRIEVNPALLGGE